MNLNLKELTSEELDRLSYFIKQEQEERKNNERIELIENFRRAWLDLEKHNIFLWAKDSWDEDWQLHYDEIDFV